MIVIVRLFKDEKANRMGLKVWEREALEKFEAKIVNQDQPFPCIPATQGYTLNQFRFGFVGDPRKISSITELTALLTEFSKTSRDLGKYASLIIFFETPADLIHSYKIEQYEQLFWNLLTQLHDRDPFDWPSNFPLDPHNPIWEFCFHHEKYFIYCATPSHTKRMSRHFPYLTFAITPRWVLEEFNTSRTIANKIKANIRKRLENYDSVPAHPSLNTYGKADNFEWRQYFLHDDETTLAKCPFHTFVKNRE